MGMVKMKGHENTLGTCGGLYIAFSLLFKYL